MDSVSEHVRLVGQRVRARRQWLGLSMAEVGKRLLMDHQQIQRYETGPYSMRTFTLVKFAETLDTTPHDLLGWDRAADLSEPTLLLADPHVSAIIRRLRDMDPEKRSFSHALICTVDSR